jgi:uncharacterized protein (TIGR03086 family)
MIDLTPATEQMAVLIGGVSDLQLADPTPCPDYSVGDLLDHIGGLSLAFTAAARKDTDGPTGQPPSGDASRLGDDWRHDFPQRLAALAQAWRDPSAFEGMTKAGGIDLPGQIAGLVALDELVVHGWDLARATGQAYHCDQPTLANVQDFVSQFSAPGQEDQRSGLFGPVVHVPDDAPLLDRVIGLTGRDPKWSADGRATRL